MPSSDHLNEQELRLEILRIVKETGTEFQKKEPLPICDKYYKWVCFKPSFCLPEYY